ncbi:MAG TPA: hypothetical protein VE907_11690 [Gammaproteobacteria bacterium]|nr:hypothetical protein [Gammaproteobacteria bacterium]
MSPDPSSRDTAQPGEEALAGEAEAWEPWETALVLLTIAVGLGGLVGLGWLVDHFILV